MGSSKDKEVKKEKKDKSEKKEKKEKKEEKVEKTDKGDDGEEKTLKGDYEARLFVSPIAEPLAGDKLTKKLLKLVRKGMKDKIVRRGVKETVKAVRKGAKGLVIIAADISPIDVLSHLPILCEENGVSYMYVRSRAEVGEACKTKRPTSCVMVTKPDKKKLEETYESFKECNEKIISQNKYL